MSSCASLPGLGRRSDEIDVESAARRMGRAAGGRHRAVADRHGRQREQPGHRALTVLPPRNDLRTAIETARDRAGRTRTSIARAVARRIGCHELSVMRYLRGETDGSGALIGAILDEVGLEVRPRP